MYIFIITLIIHINISYLYTEDTGPLVSDDEPNSPNSPSKPEDVERELAYVSEVLAPKLVVLQTRLSNKDFTITQHTVPSEHDHS